MTKESRRSLLVSSWKKRSRFIASTVALAALSIDSSSETTKDNREIKDRFTDDSIRDTDKIEATVSKLEFESETDVASVGIVSGILTKAERIRLAKEVAPFKQFRSDVKAIPLKLYA